MQIYEVYENIITLIEDEEKLEYLRERIRPSCGTKEHYVVEELETAHYSEEYIGPLSRFSTN